jgi:hypothetical protein
MTTVEVPIVESENRLAWAAPRYAASVRIRDACPGARPVGTYRAPG